MTLYPRLQVPNQPNHYRCRGQKLRCVRATGITHSTDKQTIGPCVRCVKAGADCISDFPIPRKATKYGRSPSSMLPLSTHLEHNPSNSSLPKNSTTPLPQRPSPVSNYRGRDEPEDRCNPRAVKRRSTNQGHLGFGSANFDALSVESSPSFSTSKGSFLPQREHFTVDIASFSLSWVSESYPKAQVGDSMMNMLLGSASGTDNDMFALGTRSGEANASWGEVF